MDELRRHAVPLVERWRKLNRQQQLAMVAVFVISVVGFSFVIGQSQEDMVSIQEGRNLSSKELASIQATWREQGLTHFRRDGAKLLVPRNEATRYRAALSAKPSTDSANLGNEWDKQFAKANFLTSHEQLEQLKDNALRNELSRVLKAIPGIADAVVICARGKSRSVFSNRSKVTATINVTPSEGHDISPVLAQSLRTAVAHMIPDLEAADVVVLDQSTGLAITNDVDAVLTPMQLRRQQDRLSKVLEEKVQQALSHVPGVAVSVMQPTYSAPLTHHVARPVLDSDSSRCQTSEHVWSAEWQDFSNRSRPAAADQNVGTHTLASVATFEPTSPITFSDSPQDLVKLTTFTTSSGINHSPTGVDDSRKCSAWNVLVTVPASYFEARLAEQLLSSKSAGSAIAEPDLQTTECHRLQQLVLETLWAHVTNAEVSVVRSMDVPATASVHSETPFTAWPHLTCFAFGTMIVIAFGRRVTKSPNVHRNLEVAAVSRPDNDASDAISEMTTPCIEADTSTESCPSSVAVTLKAEPLDPVERLRRCDPQDLADALQSERPQTIAVLLASFSASHASDCMSRLSSGLQTEVIRRLKSLGDIPLELSTEIASAIAQKLNSQDAVCSHNRIAHLLNPESSQRAVV